MTLIEQTIVVISGQLRSTNDVLAGGSVTVTTRDALDNTNLILSFMHGEGARVGGCQVDHLN